MYEGACNYDGCIFDFELFKINTEFAEAQRAAEACFMQFVDNAINKCPRQVTDFAVDERTNLHFWQSQERKKLFLTIFFFAALCASANSAFQNDRRQRCPATLTDAPNL